MRSVHILLERERNKCEMEGGKEGKERKEGRFTMVSVDDDESEWNVSNQTMVVRLWYPSWAEKKGVKMN
jgi:hypothetical protein